MSGDGLARLCPDHRSDNIRTQACTNCAQARRIDELEQTVKELCEHVEELAARVEELERDTTADAEDTTQESPPIAQCRR